jgi:hypothetical protein
VEELSKDMATHISKYESCLQRYATRSVPSTDPEDDNDTSMAAGSRDRALQIAALLGQLDPDVQRRAAEKQNGNNGDDEYDPWANINLRR